MCETEKSGYKRGAYAVDTGILAAVTLEVTGRTVEELETKAERLERDEFKFFDIIKVKPGRYEVEINVNKDKAKGYLEANDGVIVFGDFGYFVNGEAEHISPSPGADNRSNYDKLVDRTTDGDCPREFCLPVQVGDDGVYTASIKLNFLHELGEMDYVVFTEDYNPPMCFVPTIWQAEDLRDCDRTSYSAIIRNDFGQMTEMLFKKLNKEKEDQYKYQKAYNLLMEYWNCFPEDDRVEINDTLNTIFGKDHPEYSEIE